MEQHKDRRNRVLNVLKQPGWSDIIDLYQEQLKAKEKRLRSCTDWQLDKLQGYIEGIEFIFKKVDVIIKGEKENVTSS